MACYSDCGCGCDCGPNPSVLALDDLVRKNRNYRTALWTGEHLQITAMCIAPGCSLGLECHPHTDQLLHIVQGQCCVRMGDDRNCLDCRSNARAGCAVCIPAGTWHDICNTGCVPLKVCSVYAPPQHPRGTVHRTAADATDC